jgi:4-hydroxy-4-methyl-2-oxoglutarate aldolase
MTYPATLAPLSLEKLKGFDSCAVSNPINRLNVGFTSGASRCRFPHLAPIVGYAATARVGTSAPPMIHRCDYNGMEWWNYVACLPKLRDFALEALDFQVFARRSSVSHAYAHIAEFGEPVDIDGLKIAPGDLLHGGRNAE